MRRRYMLLRLLAPVLIVLAGCAAPQASTNIPETPRQSAPPTAAPTPQATPSEAEFSLGRSVARSFGSGEETLLYAGLELTNTGNCPAYVDNVSVDFEVEGVGTLHTDFQPVASGYDVVAPGGKTFVALWFPAKKDIPQTAAITLFAELAAKQSGEGGLPLIVKNARVVQNYPGFSTVSGSLWNENAVECPLNVVYVAFFDESDSLLGVYHFTKNAGIFAGEFKNFVVHMRQLPIEDLAQNTARVEAHAFGIE